MNVTTSEYGEVYIWPYPFQEPFVESWEWLNYEQTMYSGREDRTNFRENPRLRLELLSRLDPEDRKDAYHLLHTHAAELWGIPHWTHAEQITVSAGTTQVEVDSAFFESGFALFWKPGQEVEFREFSKDSNGLITFDALVEDYYRGLLIPVHIGAISDIRFSHATLSSDCSFSFISKEAFSIEEGIPDTYLGYDLFYECPVTTGGARVEDSIVRRIDTLDSETGVWVRNSPWSCSKIKRVFGVDVDGKEDSTQFLQWLFRRKGRYNLFWSPSWFRDLDITTEGTIGTAFSISNPGFSFCRQHIAILSKNGEWFPRHVTGATLFEGEIVLTIDSSLGLTSEEIDRVCYLDLFRLDTDRIELQYTGYRSVYSSFTIKSVYYLPVE